MWFIGNVISLGFFMGLMRKKKKELSNYNGEEVLFLGIIYFCLSWIGVIAQIIEEYDRR